MEKQRMYDITDCKVCQDCKYYYRDSKVCGYCLMVGKSRIFGENGKRRIKKNMCDKYKPGASYKDHKEMFVNDVYSC